MEKRSLIAIGIAFLILIGWYYVFPPPQTPPPGAPVPVPAAASAPSPAPATSETARPAPAEVVPAAGGPIAAEKIEDVPFENDLFQVVFTNKGARAASWRLKKYQGTDGKFLEVVPGFAVRDDLLPLALDLDDAALGKEINAALFKVEREAAAPNPAGEPGERIRFSWSDGRGIEVRKSLVFRRGDYLVDLEVEVADRGRRIPARVAWGPGFEVLEPGSQAGTLHYTGQAVWNEGGRVTRTARNRVKADFALPDSGRLLWAGIEEQFFAALILPSGSKGGVLVRPMSVVPTPEPGAAADAKAPKPDPQLLVAATVPSEGAQLFVGPKKYTMLRGMGRDLEAVVWFSSYGLIYWPAKYLFLSLLWVHDRLAPNYGLAIILATLILRLLLFPLNQYSMVHMRKMQAQMQRMQPKVNAIKAKYKKNKDAQSRGKMNEETMALYRKEGVNPMGGMSGCMPLLIQFPIMIAFYNILTVAVELKGAPFFGWIRDLTLKDPYFVTPLLMGATMFIQQKMSTTKGGDPMQQRMMLMMPVIFTVMFLNLPSGLVLYWFVNNVLGIGQQWLVNRHFSKLDAAPGKV